MWLTVDIRGLCCIALLNIVKDLLVSLNDGNIFLLASLDLSTAFDTIDHNILLSKSALLIMSLLSDPELKPTFSVLPRPTNCLNLPVVICVFISPYQLCCWMSACFL